MAPSLDNLLTASLQIACVTVAAWAVAAVLRVTAAGVRYGFWRGVLVLCLALPWLQSAVPAASIGGFETEPTIAEPMVAVETVTLTPSAIDWALWLGLLILGGICLRIVWLAIGCVGLRKLRREGQPTPADDHQQLQSALRTNANVRYVATVQQPVTFGVFRPVVLLPETLQYQTAATRHAVIAHELVHVRRRDWCWVVAEEMLRAMFWFHPAMWWLISRIQLAREEVVDATVVAITGRRREYLDALLAFADDVPLSPAPAFARRRHLFRRIVLLSTEDVMTARRLVISALVMAVVVAAASWTAVRAFPLEGLASSMSSSQQSSIAALQQGPGPVERSAKPASHNNPVPKLIFGETPGFPATAGSDYTSVTVTLRTTINEAGNVAELRLGGFAFRRGGISAAVAGETFEQFAARAMFKDAELGAVTAQAMRPAFEAFIESAADAVHRWQYEPPRDGPMVFNTIVSFAYGRPTITSIAFVTGGRTNPDGAIRVGGAIRTPVKVRDVKPVYPLEAQEARVQGVVIAEIRIEADGRVSEAQILRSIPMLDQAARDAVMQWEFMPTHLNGVPTPVIMTVTVQFSLQ